ncbi:dihydrolipoyllysine-residue acetyltransferase component of pyruvate dehydrogenase complex [Patella vulgata]|uniref:dihydrolipoyllysine-residue acetyltransferase component of pyruvate dehydrogenase complex n=1 Tax=Patella vulgata TaxID=6465 RepID=UPI00218089FA|nr:dihydrolipoyllysine-residue acetyltransferase component of pyruvate dehydrogenase complex [Patella vulgata]
MASSIFKVGQACRLLFKSKATKAPNLWKIVTLSERQIQTSSKWMGVTQLLMPSLSPTMEEGNIIAWHKKEGDKINPGDVLCDIQTDKAVVSMDTEEEGILAKILIPDNAKEIKVGVLIGLVVDEGDDWQNVEIPADAPSSSSPEKTTSQSSSAAPQSDSVSSTTTPQKNNFMGPSVKKLLEEYGVKAAEVPHTGPHGALVKSDVITYIESKKIPRVQFDAVAPSVDTSSSISSQPVVSELPALDDEPYIDIPHTSMRKTIAKRLTESKSTVPHSYASINCRVSSVNHLRKRLVEQGIKVSMNDFIIKAVGLALQRVPRLNSTWKDGSAHISQTVDISVAVATDNGLITPIVKNAASLEVDEISSTVKELAGRARLGKLQLHEFQGGSFSISNLGMFGIKEFTAVINPPQTAIMAVGTSRILIGSDGSPTPIMTVTLSYDSRVVDEIDASEFLEMFTSIIESPEMMVQKSLSQARGFF